MYCEHYRFAEHTWATRISLETLAASLGFAGLQCDCTRAVLRIFREAYAREYSPWQAKTRAARKRIHADVRDFLQKHEPPPYYVQLAVYRLYEAQSS